MFFPPILPSKINIIVFLITQCFFQSEAVWPCNQADHLGQASIPMAQHYFKCALFKAGRLKEWSSIVRSAFLRQVYGSVCTLLFIKPWVDDVTFENVYLFQSWKKPR